jgi:50S ribosomal protein L16 3-hydroxylase
MSLARPPLGGLSAAAFLRDYWQKRPLLIRQAVPGFAGVLDRRALFGLAAQDDAEARLIRRSPRWRVDPGPLEPQALGRLGRRNWTLLLNGLNLLNRDAERLLRRFAFIPWSRLDDVMVSYATDGGGVGPHVDSYDVFLLQGPGRRRWRIAPPRKWRLADNAPLRLIEGFRHATEYVLEPGDMLYLPPDWGHDGVALGECWTYSVGFRAPRGRELAAAFLDFLHERGLPDAVYRDADRRPQAHAGRLDAHMIGFAAQALSRIRWNRADVAAFLGGYLSEPKPQVVFRAPRRPLPVAAFRARAGREGVCLDARSLLLVHAGTAFLNGEAHALARTARPALLTLADARCAGPEALGRGTPWALLYDWYLQGWVHPGEKTL